MWKFVSASTSNSHPQLVSLNKNQGRQTWEFDPDGGTPELKAKVEELRAGFTATKDKQKHSADELLRLQIADKVANKKFSPPQTPLNNDEEVTPQRVAEHLRGGISFYECLQQEDGHFPGDYGGPMFLMPGLVITLYTCEVMDKVLTAQHKQEMIRYLSNHQNTDGGFGLHIEGPSTMFGTVLRCVCFADAAMWSLPGSTPMHQCTLNPHSLKTS